MDQFHDRNNLPKFPQEEINNLSKPVSTKDIAPIINNIPNRRYQGQIGSQMHSSEHLRTELYQFSTIKLMKLKAGNQ
jgi:hypothetical protein